MPRPPPPKAAFRMIGKPAVEANACASSALDIAVSVPGTTGTPISVAIALAVVLLPIACRVGGNFSAQRSASQSRKPDTDHTAALRSMDPRETPRSRLQGALFAASLPNHLPPSLLP